MLNSCIQAAAPPELFSKASRLGGCLNARRDTFCTEGISYKPGSLLCPRCGSALVKRNGHEKSGAQKMKCLRCGASFTEHTDDLLFGSKRMRDMFRLFLGYFYHDETLGAVCDCLGISAKTSYMWRARLFECMKGCQRDVALSDGFWLDVTFIELDRKGLVRCVLSEKDRYGSFRDRSHLSAIVVDGDDEGQTLIMHEGRGGEKLWGSGERSKGIYPYESTIVNDGFLVQMGIADEYGTFAEKVDALMSMCHSVRQRS